MDVETKYKLHKLCIYLDNLPDSLPFREEAESDYAFHYFGFGDSDEEDYGLEGAVNRQFEVRLGHRRDGPVRLKERGPGLSAVIIVLENYLTELPESVILKKWVDDLILSTRQVFENAKHPLPIVPKHVNPCQAAPKSLSTPSPTVKSNNEPDADDQTRTEHRALPRVRKQVQKLDSKVLSTFEDPAHTDLPEKEDKWGSGIKTLPLLLEVSLRCQKMSGMAVRAERQQLALTGTSEIDLSSPFFRDILDEPTKSRFQMSMTAKSLDPSSKTLSRAIPKASDWDSW